VRPWFWVVLEAGVIVAFTFLLSRTWAGLEVWLRVVLVWGVVSGVIAWFCQLSGTEIIEFDGQKLTIRKDIFSWEHQSEYSIEKCKELEWWCSAKGGHYGLAGAVLSEIARWTSAIRSHKMPALSQREEERSDEIHGYMENAPRILQDGSSAVSQNGRQSA
jgi:hypothetical protein